MEQVPYSSLQPDKNSSFPYIEPSQVGIDQAKLKTISNELLKWVRNGDLIGGELLILKGDNTILQETYGWLNKEENKPVIANSIWYVRSLSKPITATAVMLLVEEGKLSLDDKISKYFPDFTGYPQTTIADLLAHRAGYTLSDDRGIGYTDYESIIALADTCASIKPSEKYSSFGYDNNSYAILGGIVEKVTEQTIDEFIDEQIFQVLDMKDSYTNISDDPDFRDRLNTWYHLHPFSQEYFVSRTHMRPAYPYYIGLAGILSTVTDYAKFLSAFRNKGKWNNKELLPNEAVDKMLTKYGFADRGPFEVGFGYGWWVNVDHDNPNTVLNFGHEGGDEFIAYVYPEQDLTILFFNSSKNNQISNSVKDLLGWSGLVRDSKMISTTSASNFKDSVEQITLKESQNYIGSYIGPKMRGNQYPLIKIERQNDRLMVGMTYLGFATYTRRYLFYKGNDQFLPGRYYNDRPDWVNPNLVLKFNDNKEQNKSLALVFNGQVAFEANYLAEDSVEEKANKIKEYRLIDNVVRKLIHTKGLSEAKKIALELHDEKPETVLFAEDRLNRLGYRYLEEKKYMEAITTFEINTEVYPDSPNCLDSLADAWEQSGNHLKAKEFFTKALHLAQKQNDPHASRIEKKLEGIKEMINKQKD